MMSLAPLLGGAVPSPAPPERRESDELAPAPRRLFPELEARLDAAYVPRPRARFAPVTPTERRRFAEAFALLLGEAAEGSPAPSGPARTAFDGLGFRVETMSLSPRDRVWAITEQPERLRGAGVFLIRTGPDAAGWSVTAPAAAVQRVVLMAPHPRADRGTEVLAQRLFGLSRARALVQGTVHRRTPASDGSEADPAHRADTFFQVATEVLDARIPDQMFLQLHGFELKRHADVAPATAVILSDGNTTPRPHPRFSAAAAALRARHRPGTIALFGTDTRQLGGTTNVQARHINARAKNTFLHIEMSAGARTAALADTSGLRPPAGTWAHSLLQLIAGR